MAQSAPKVFRYLFLLAVIFCMFADRLPAGAASSAESAEARQQEAAAAWNEAVANGTKGPATQRLLDEAYLRVPANMMFIPPAPAARLLRAWGNKVEADPLGLVVGLRDEDEWVTVIHFVKEGYIKDDDAKDWNADELLATIRQGTEDSNHDRISRGFEPIEVVGWIAAPRYDASTHRLVSSVAKRAKGAPPDAVQGINYDTFALGRNGYFVLDTLTDQTHVTHDKGPAADVLAGLEYTPGHRYTDFNASTDHVAAYGLAALVGAIAVKKLGLLALAGVIALKFAKVGAIVLAGLAALVARLFKRKPKTSGDAA
jgi:uncharacterized membrane-anchored protein